MVRETNFPRKHGERHLDVVASGRGVEGAAHALLGLRAEALGLREGGEALLGGTLRQGDAYLYSSYGRTVSRDIRWKIFRTLLFGLSYA